MKSKKDAERIAAAVVRWFCEVDPYGMTDSDAAEAIRATGRAFYANPPKAAEETVLEILRACDECELKETAPELFAAGLQIVDGVFEYAERGRLVDWKEAAL